MTMPDAITATYSQSATLDKVGDNATVIQSFIDSLPAGVTVTIPAGTWHVHSPIVALKSLTLQAPEGQEATLRLVASNKSAHVLTIGRYHGNDPLPVHNVTLRRLTFEIAGEKTHGLYNCVFHFGDNFTAEDCVFAGSPHEGIAGGGKLANIRRCKAIGCGHGNTIYAMSTAGFNSHSWPMILEDSETINCPQGCEIDGHGSKILRCKFHSPPPGITPQMGVNIGSTGFGINDVEIANCEIIGFDTGVGFGNGIGRLANVHIHDNLIDGGGCGGMGGRTTNLATDPAYPPGPDTGHTIIERNTFVVRTQHNGVCGLSTGPTTNAELTREPVSFLDNDFYFIVQVNDAPSLGIGGRWDGPVVMKRNKFFCQNAAPSRGDIAVFTSNDNLANPGQPGLTLEGNVAVKSDGMERPLVIKIEGATP